METPRERSPSPELRCAVCRDSAAGAARCERCGTWVHDECRGPTGVCPTLGCGPAPAQQVTAPFEQPDPNDWRPLALVLPLLLGGLLLYRPSIGRWAFVVAALVAIVCFGALLVDLLRGGRRSPGPSHPAWDTVGWGPRLAVGIPVAWALAVVLFAPPLGFGDATCVLAFAGVPVGIALAQLLRR